MRLCEICAAPCFPDAGPFVLPAPGAVAGQFLFGRDRDRDFYAILLNNHAPIQRMQVNPRIAVLGLSPAITQMKVLEKSYREHGDYGRASMDAAFSGEAGVSQTDRRLFMGRQFLNPYAFDDLAGGFSTLAERARAIRETAAA